jgi:arylsulfate sulfotransferase
MGNEMIKKISLPEGFPPIVIHKCDAARREPGYMILSVGKSVRAISATSEFEALIALDQDGEVVWFWQSDVALMDVKLTPRNTLLVVTTDGCIQEINFGGDVLRKWFTPARKPKDIKDALWVDTPYFHHAVIELPNRALAALSIATRELDDIPLSENDIGGPKGKRLSVGDELVEFTRDGIVARRHDFFDILDPHRIGYGFDAPFWTKAEVVPDGGDWTHANGICHDPSEDSFIISVRHQDCLIKIDRKTGDLKWILGTPVGWRKPWSDKLLKPIGDFPWPWHTHDPSIMADGSILCFDNGESGAFPPDPKPDITQCASRAVAYRVDEKAITVEQVWSFGGPDHDAPFSMYVSGAYELPTTGNVFATFGGITLRKDDLTRTSMPPEGHGSAEVFEVTRTDPPEVLFHAELNNRDTGEALGWAIFRAEHVPSLG